MRKRPRDDSKQARSRKRSTRKPEPARASKARAGAKAESPRRGRPPISPAIQRARLLDAARAALQKGDYGSVRISDVVHSAGMSSRTFYEHFDSKEDVLIELMAEAGRQLVAEIEAIMSTTDGDERIDRFLDAYLTACTSTPLDIDSLGEGLTSRVQQSLREGVRDASVQVAVVLARMWDAKTMRPPPQPAAIEVALLGLLGLASRYVHERRVGELAGIRPALRGLLVRLWS